MTLAIPGPRSLVRFPKLKRHRRLPELSGRERINAVRRHLQAPHQQRLLSSPSSHVHATAGPGQAAARGVQGAQALVLAFPGPQQQRLQIREPCWAPAGPLPAPTLWP